MKIEQFKSSFGRVARPTLFQVQLQFPGASVESTFFCKGASIPTRTIGEIEIPFMGRKTFQPGDATYEPWTITIFNDVNFTVRRELENWHEIMNEAKNNRGVSNLSEYERDLSVFHLDDQENILKQYIFKSAWPTNSGDEIALDWGSADTAEEYSVQFRYDYWTTPDVTRD